MKHRTIPRPTEPNIAGKIGGPQWNNQGFIDEQLRAIMRNDRWIIRGQIILIIEIVLICILALVLYALAR